MMQGAVRRVAADRHFGGRKRSGQDGNARHQQGQQAGHRREFSQALSHVVAVHPAGIQLAA